MMNTQERHRRDRPLHHLTERELDVLDQLGNVGNVFRSHIQAGLMDLADLAAHEIAQRELEKELRNEQETQRSHGR